jgi:hypothetical protein
MRSFGSEESGINKTARECSSQTAQSIAGPIPDVRSGAITV